MKILIVGCLFTLVVQNCMAGTIDDVLSEIQTFDKLYKNEQQEVTPRFFIRRLRRWIAQISGATTSTNTGSTGSTASNNHNNAAVGGGGGGIIGAIVNGPSNIGTGGSPSNTGASNAEATDAEATDAEEAAEAENLYAEIAALEAQIMAQNGGVMPPLDDYPDDDEA